MRGVGPARPPASGYLMGTYENPSNAGDGYSMAYHAGAELTGIECYQINPLIKDYNGPACAYVTGPLGGFTVNAEGNRFLQSDYWSGQMMLEFYRELNSPKGPVYLKLDHLAEETVKEIEKVLHTTERPSRGRFHQGRGNNYRENMVEMAISEIGLCSGHSGSGCGSTKKGRPRCPGCMRQATWPACPMAICWAPSPMGKSALNAVEYIKSRPESGSMTAFVAREKARVFEPL